MRVLRQKDLSRMPITCQNPQLSPLLEEPLR
jgi:hypothetical protein